MRKIILAIFLFLGLVMAACAPGTPPESGSGEGDSAPASSDEQAGSIRDEIGEITLITGESNLGEKPLLQWAAVEGAAEYSLVVRDADGQVYWAWRGAGTEIPFGGAAADGQVGQNAYLHDNMSWVVVAYDAAQLPIAISAEEGLAP